MHIPEPALLQVGGSNFDIEQPSQLLLCVYVQVEVGECGLQPLRWDKLYSFRQLSQFCLGLTHGEVICKKWLKKQVCTVDCL